MNIRNILGLSLIGAQVFATAACSGHGAERSVGFEPPATAAMTPKRMPTAAAPMSPDALQQVDIIDPAGFGQPVVAAVAYIPDGWRTQGGVGWNRATNCVTNQLQIAWSATSPDGAQAFEILPGFNWQVQGTQVQMNPCPAMPFASTRDFLQAVVQQNRAGARILQYRDRADLVQPASANPNAQVRQDAGQVLIAYVRDGQEMRETLGTTVAFSDAGGNVVAGTGMVFAQRGPAGALDFALGDRIASSIRPNPQWLEAMRNAGNRVVAQYSDRQRSAIDDWNNREMARISARGAAERAAISSSTLREVAAINAQTHANTMATNDRIQAGNLEAIGEYHTWRGTDGGEVRSSIHGGDRVLQMQNGDAFSTSDPYFNPSGSTELERVR
jgi:hypothetical protein